MPVGTDGPIVVPEPEPELPAKSNTEPEPSLSPQALNIKVNNPVINMRPRGQVKSGFIIEISNCKLVSNQMEPVKALIGHCNILAKVSIGNINTLFSLFHQEKKEIREAV